MINSLSMGSLKSTETSSCSKPKLPSPTTSVSESNVVPTSELEPNPTTFQGLKFDADIDVEVQSPDNSIWDSLFADQIDSVTDFMISSPRRDFMMCSPKRDYMVSSPKRDYMVSSPMRDYMVSSPKREYMVSSPKREYTITVTSPKRSALSSVYNHNNGYVHGMNYYGSHTTTTATANHSHNNTSKGKSPSPLHKVFNCSNNSLYSTSTSPQYGSQGETLALPAMDAFLDEYGLYSKGGVGIDEGYDIGVGPVAVAATMMTLLDCLSMPSTRYGDTIGVGLQMSGGEGDSEGYGGLLQQGGGREVVENGGALVGAKAEAVDVAYHQGLLGPACETEQDQDSGLQLVHLLLACAESVAKDDYMSARRFLHHLNRVVSPLGDSMQRVASCFADALSARLLLSSSPSSPSSASAPKPPHYTLDQLKIYQILYQACPYVKFAHFTANQAIFEAFESEDRVHVIDLDILQGYQWPAFMQALAARPGGPPSLRITGVGTPPELVRETGRHLADLAHSLRLPFHFHPVAEKLEDLRPHMLHRRVGEALAVNSVNRLHHVLSPHLANLIAMIRDQAPNIVTLVEQEASHNGPHFLGRFLEALHYYSAIFDSLDATFPADSAARAKVEQHIFAPEIRNIVACEGLDRVERHERLDRWRKVMEGKGFKGVPLSPNAITQSNILLGLYSCDGYRLTEDKGCLLLGWQDRPIIAASAWRC